MTPRRAVALTVGLALAAGLTAYGVTRDRSDGGRESLSPASSDGAVPNVPAPALSARVVLTSVPAVVPPRRSRLEPLVGSLPDLRVEPRCPKVLSLPEPVASFDLPTPGLDVREAQLVGDRMWFGAMDRDHLEDVHLEGVQLGGAHDVIRSPVVRSLQLLAAGDGRAWGVTIGPGGLVELDLGSGAIIHRWTGDQLAPRSGRHGVPQKAVSVVVAGGSAYALGEPDPAIDPGTLWLAAIDVPTGKVRWSHDLPGATTFTSYLRHAVLAAHGDDVYVAQAGYGMRDLPGLEVWRLDGDGEVRAHAWYDVATIAPEPPRLVATASGVYLVIWTPVKGDQDTSEAWQLVRLDAHDLRLQAHLPFLGLWNVDAGPTGIWTLARACDSMVMTRHDPMTLVPLEVLPAHQVRGRPVRRDERSGVGPGAARHGGAPRRHVRLPARDDLTSQRVEARWYSRTANGTKTARTTRPARSV